VIAPDSGSFGWPKAEADRTTRDPISPWGRDEDLTSIEVRPRLAVAPDLLLRQLDPEPLGDVGESIIEGLRPLYESITAGAAALALGEPDSEAAKPEGKGGSGG
jgi:hypothetical protein